MNSPTVSVIIPCYNQGEFLADSIGSVLASTMDDYEIIVVDDGSSDGETCRILESLVYPRTRLLRTANGGLAAARNNGIAAARGRYILPLDADDRIAPGYLEKGVAVLDARPEIGIVYCLAETFGERVGPWSAPDFSLRAMLLGNLIFCSAMFRRAAWEQVGGYNSSMAHGWEDWDFWLSLIEAGAGVHRIPMLLFFYRTRPGSMARSMDISRKVEMHLQVMHNHPGLYIEGSRPLLDLYYRITSSGLYLLLKRLGLSRWISRLLGKP